MIQAKVICVFFFTLSAVLNVQAKTVKHSNNFNEPTVVFSKIYVFPMVQSIDQNTRQNSTWFKWKPGQVPTSKDPRVIIDHSCGNKLSIFLDDLFKPFEFKPQVRTWPATAYESLKETSCIKSQRCGNDTDCASLGSQGFGKCYTLKPERFSSQSPCPPLDPQCGCCQPTAAQNGFPDIPSLTLNCNVDRETVVSTEAYSLTITSEGSILIEGSSAHGVSYGIETLGQVFRWDSEQNIYIIREAPLTIHDFPRFQYRGLMIDTSRHFIPVKELLLALKGMHANKLNVFHWHITDSQSWPYESQAYPELSAEGAFHAKKVYTTDDIQKILDYASQIFVDVIPEFDMPAHSMSMAKSHPEIFDPGCWKWLQTFGKQDDRNDALAIDVTLPNAQHIATTIYNEAAKLFSTNTSSFGAVCIGNDEVKPACWNATQHIKDYVVKKWKNLSTQSFVFLQAEWSAKMAKTIVDSGKRPTMWQPTTAGASDPAYATSMPKSTIFLNWLSEKSLTGYANSQKWVVQAAGYYPDVSGNAYFAVDRWKKMYLVDPMSASITPENRKYVLGGQICSWGENQDEFNIHSRLWQVSGAVGERLWSDASIKDIYSAEGRLNRFLCRLKYSGISTPPLWPSDCFF